MPNLPRSHATRYQLPLFCGTCGGPARAHRNAERVVIRCEQCGQRLFAYYLDPARDGETPPEREDLFFVKLVERDLLRLAGPPAQALYDYLRRFIKAHSYPPTLREIQMAFGWGSPSTAQYFLNQLVDIGLIERDYGASRGIRLVHVA